MHAHIAMGNQMLRLILMTSHGHVVAVDGMNRITVRRTSLGRTSVFQLSYSERFVVLKRTERIFYFGGLLLLNTASFQFKTLRIANYL
jgi:hypothetical protein